MSAVTETGKRGKKSPRREMRMAAGFFLLMVKKRGIHVKRPIHRCHRARADADGDHRLVSAGFTVANQSNRSVTLVKRKQFSIPILIIGFLLCVIPLLVYLVVYAFQSDQIVEIRLIDKPEATPYRASDHVPGRRREPHVGGGRSESSS